MADTAERPFLGEVIRPVATVDALEGADVLDDAGLLVVRLLDKEAVVLDLGDNRIRQESEYCHPEHSEGART
jgi:hypothetical protein